MQNLSPENPGSQNKNFDKFFTGGPTQPTQPDFILEKIREMSKQLYDFIDESNLSLKVINDLHTSQDMSIRNISEVADRAVMLKRVKRQLERLLDRPKAGATPAGVFENNFFIAINGYTSNTLAILHFFMVQSSNLEEFISFFRYAVTKDAIKELDWLHKFPDPEEDSIDYKEPKDPFALFILKITPMDISGVLTHIEDNKVISDVQKSAQQRISLCISIVKVFYNLRDVLLRLDKNQEEG